MSGLPTSSLERLKSPGAISISMDFADDSKDISQLVNVAEAIVAEPDNVDQWMEMYGFRWDGSSYARGSGSTVSADLEEGLVAMGTSVRGLSGKESLYSAASLLKMSDARWVNTAGCALMHALQSDLLSRRRRSRLSDYENDLLKRISRFSR